MAVTIVRSVLQAIDPIRPVIPLIEEYNTWNLASLDVGDIFECQVIGERKYDWHHAYITRVVSTGSFMVQYCAPMFLSQKWIMGLDEAGWKVSPCGMHLPRHQDFKSNCPVYFRRFDCSYSTVEKATLAVPADRTCPRFLLLVRGWHYYCKPTMMSHSTHFSTCPGCGWRFRVIS